MPAHRQHGDGGEKRERFWLQDGERLLHQLTNRQVGVERVDRETAIRPGEDRDAVAGVTDRRVVFVVGGPAGHDGDFVRSLWHGELAGASVETEALTTRWVFETGAGERWAFTARETDTDGVATAVERARRNPTTPHRAVKPLVEHCTVLAVHLEREQWTAFDERQSAAWATLDRAREAAGSRTDGPREAVARLGCELYRLARDRHLRAGRAALSAAQRHLDVDALAACYRRAQSGADQFEAARKLSERADIDSKPAVTGLVGADDLAETSLGRLLATAKMHRSDAAGQTDPEERIRTLEAALDIYNTAASFVTDERVDDGVQSRARTESERAIRALIDARLDAASDHRGVGNRALADGNRKRAREAYLRARDDVDRALELARSFPPGDPDSIRTRQEALTAQLAPLTGDGTA